MMSLSKEDVSAQPDVDVKLSQNPVATYVEEIEPFPFLDLPKDIRLCVYDNLLTRTHCEVSLSTYSQKDPRITLVTSNPIAPTNQTCKLLHDEAGSFVKAKLEWLSSPWAAPRLIIEPGSGANKLLLEQGGLLDEMMRYMRCFREKDLFSMEPFPGDLSYGSIRRDEGLSAIEDFVERAENFMSDLNVLSMSWLEEAEWRLVYEEDEGNEDWCEWYDFVPTKREEMDKKRWKEIVDYAHFLSYEGAYNGVRGLLQIVVVTDGTPHQNFDMKKFLDGLAKVCKDNTVKTSISTFGWSSEVDGKGYNEYMRFDGEMDKRTWHEEWA